MKYRVALAFSAFLAVCVNSASGIDFQDVGIHGFLSQGYLKSDANDYLGETEDGTFQFNEAGINFSTALTGKLRLGIQIFAHDMGEIGNNEPFIDWAYADYKWKDWLGIRAGKIKKSMGFYNEIRDIDSLRTSIILPQCIYLESERDTVVATQGIGLYGDLFSNVFGDFSYQMQYGTMEVASDGGTAKRLESYNVGVDDFDVNYTFDAAVNWYTPLEGLRFKASLNNLEMDIAGRTLYPAGPVPPNIPMSIKIEDFLMSIYSVEYSWRSLVLSSECLRLKMKRDMGFGPVQKTDSVGYYFSISYRFNKWTEAGAYYSEYYADLDDKDGESHEAMGRPAHQAWQKDFTLSLRFDLNESWTFKVEGHAIDGTGLLLPVNGTVGTERDWFLFASKASYTF